MNFITGRCLLYVLFLCTLTCYARDEVRLVGGNSSYGRVEVFLEDTWKTTVTQYWREIEGAVVCRQLGFRGVHSVTLEEPTEDIKQATERIFKCEGYELSLLGCAQLNVEDYGDSFYSYVQYSFNSIAHVSCKTSTFSPATNVRLIDGGGYNGMVEVLLEGTWHRTCDTHWTKLEGGVICRQLGYPGVYSVAHNLTHENGTRRVHSVRFTCRGYEESLMDCPQNNLVNSSDNTDICESDTSITCLHDMSISGNDFSVPPFRLNWPSSKNIYERKVGDELTLKCNVTSATEIYWKHRTWSRTQPVTHNNVLRLDNISLSDHGSYVCFAKGSRGQIIESKPQVVIITDYAQIVLTLGIRSLTKGSEGHWPVVVRNRVVEQFRNSSAFNPVSVGNVNSTHFSLQLVNKLKTGMHHNTINNSEIDSVVAGIQVFWTNTSSFKEAGYWIQGLSFCIGGSEDTSAGVLTFPSTVINSTVSSYESCFTSNLPRASRKCEGDSVTVAEWKDTTIHNCFEDLSNHSRENRDALVQEFFTNVQEEDLSLDNVSAISHDLADITGSDAIKTEDIDQVANILNKISNVNSSSPKVTRNVLEVLDNVLTISTEDEGSSLVPKTSSSLLNSLEQQLESVQKSGANFSDNRPNIAVEVVQIQNFDSPITFASLDPQNDRISETTLGQDVGNIDPKKIETSIQLPNYIIQKFMGCSLSQNTSKVTFPVTFAIHRSEALFNDPQATATNFTQNSWVVSTSTLCEVSDLPSEHLVSTQFSPTKRTSTDSDDKCVFWDHNLRGEGIGGWSSKGCSNNKIDGVELYECVCSHLPRFANFAVLIDLKGNLNSFALHILTIVGCIASVCSLIITIVSYLSIKKIRTSQPQQITLNLCFALLCLYLSFLIGINRTDSSTICIIFGGLIHLFCLSSVAWMSVEATQLYLLLVKVVDAHVRNFLIKAASVAWGVPFIIVVICVVVRKDDYFHEHCFPKSSSFVFYIGVLGLLALMLAYNIVIYITIIWNLCAVRKNLSRSQSNKTVVLRRFQNAFAISILLGLSWCFGFLAIGSLRVAFNVLFCLFNSFQGVFIFLIFCVRQEEVRAAWKNLFGIKSRQKKRKDDVSTSQSRVLSTTKDVTTESEFTTKTSSKAFGEIQQFELEEAEDSRCDIQMTTTSTFKNESQTTSKTSGEAKQSKLVEPDHEIQTTMTSTFQNELKASSEASGETQQSPVLEAGDGRHDIQTTTTFTFQIEVQASGETSEETQQSEVVKAENGSNDNQTTRTSTFQSDFKTFSDPSAQTQQSEVVKAENGSNDNQTTRTLTFQNDFKASSDPSAQTQQSEGEKAENRSSDNQTTTTSTFQNDLKASSDPSVQT